MSKKPQRSLVLTSRGRAYLSLFVNEVKSFPVVKKTTDEEARYFLMRCGFSLRSLNRLKRLYSWVTELEILRAMKAMPLEELFICINNVREPMTMAEEEHYVDLPLRFVKGVLESTISILPGVTAIGKGLWSNGQDNVCTPHEITMVSMSGVFAASGPFSEYCQELAKNKPKQLARLYFSILKDRFTTLLKALAAQCPEGSMIALKVSGLGAGLHAFTGNVGSYSSMDFVKERLDVSLQHAILALRPDEQLKFAGICLDVHTCNHCAYGKSIRLIPLPVPYRAIKGGHSDGVYPIPESPQELLSSLSCPDQIAKRIEGKSLIQVAVTPTDWAAKELCEGRPPTGLASNEQAQSMDHAFGMSTNAMQLINNAGEGKYAKEKDDQAPYATMDTVHVMGNQTLLGESEPLQCSEVDLRIDRCTDALLSVNQLLERNRSFLLSLLERDAIASEKYREIARDLLDAHYPGLGEKADKSVKVIESLHAKIAEHQRAIKVGQSDALKPLFEALKNAQEVYANKKVAFQCESINAASAMDSKNPMFSKNQLVGALEEMNKAFVADEAMPSESSLAECEQALRQAKEFERKCREAFEAAQGKEIEGLVTPLQASIVEIQTMWKKTFHEYIEMAAKQERLASSCALWANHVSSDGTFEPQFVRHTLERGGR